MLREQRGWTAERADSFRLAAERRLIVSFPLDKDILDAVRAWQTDSGWAKGPTLGGWADAMLQELDDARADLRGLGGAGVPASQKWRDVRDAVRTARTRRADDRAFIIVNGDESEPGTFKDRELLLRYPHLVLEGLIVAGMITDATQGFIYIRHEYDAAATRLTTADVHQIVDAAVRQALVTRAAIRQPIGVPARVHVCVVDAQGNRIGSFRMDDGTNFSYDVAVQKARTAAFFSSDAAAFSSRAIGFLAQRYFPPGIGSGSQGPLFHIQNDLSGLNPTTLTPSIPKFTGVLRNGITIFPGGFPLYKNGKLAGAIGISGDGVDQDDLIGYAGTAGFRPANARLSDRLSDAQIYAALRPKLSTLETDYGVDPAIIADSRRHVRAGLDHVQLLYVKFPRNPGL